MTSDAEGVRAAFRAEYGEPDLVVRSPGRVNLIGEHTDYNLGFVMPAAIDRAIYLAIRLRDDRLLRFTALDKGDRFEGSLDELRRVDTGWPNYLMGILVELAALGIPLRGVDCAFGGDVPIGCGLSSSAALECGFAFGLDALLGTRISRIALAQLSQRSENRFVGVNCGIMDQFASCMGREQRLIRLDCRDLSYQYVPFERDDVCLVLCDSQVRRELTTSAYNQRRAECDAGVARLHAHDPEVQSLRDATAAALEAIRSEIDPVVYRRCSYIIAENERVLAVSAALDRGDLAAVGAALYAAHEGMARDFEISVQQLDALVEGAKALPGVIGARMMGGGFGGCTINLVEVDALEAFRAGMAPVFRDRLGVEPVIHVCRIAAGTELVG